MIISQIIMIMQITYQRVAELLIPYCYYFLVITFKFDLGSIKNLTPTLYLRRYLNAFLNEY